MNIVDSSGWLEYFTDGSNADFFAAPINDVENLLTPTICLYEVFKRVMSEFDEERALDVIGMMTLGTIVDLNRQIAIEAARISVEHRLAMADSVILATANHHSAVLWTQDAHFKEIGGVRFIDKG